MDLKNNTKSKYQTMANAEENHLAAMSATPKVKKSLKKSTLRSSHSYSIEESIASTNSQISSLADQQSTPGIKADKVAIVTKKITTKTTAVNTTAVFKNEMLKEAATVDNEAQAFATMTSSDGNGNCSIEMKTAKKKLKSKKNKRGETDKQTISVKSSFNKFDALEKKNLIHNPQGEKEMNCKLCLKPVYKMEEIKAEKSIYHKNCFRCHECNKQLKVDNYQSHESVLYCMQHFKLLFAPKYVEDNEPEKQSKPELIIRENQPMELPPDVVRASNKPDLGLEELQQLNLRSKFQVFENPTEHQTPRQCTGSEDNSVKRSKSILTKLAKLQALGITTDVNFKDISTHDSGDNSTASDNNEDLSDSDRVSDDGDSGDKDLVRSKKRTQRERPIGLGHAMSDIKTKFEKGHLLSKEERREERKQEIQNIRSRLFMGKQARIKEMYQHAVAESEQAITSTNKKPEIEMGGAARTLKERFETGEAFKDARSEADNENNRSSGLQGEADVFESAISKKSRSIFMELDANAGGGRNPPNSNIVTPTKHQPQKSSTIVFNRYNSENEPEHVIKCDEQPEDVKVETSEISSKFKFFETYRPTECKRKEFRITPPREGVVKMPTPDSDTEAVSELQENDTNVVEKSHTTSTMLSRFREMEQNRNRTHNRDVRPLKCFTPPPDGERVIYQNQDSEEDEDDDEEEDDEEEDDYDGNIEVHRRTYQNDEALKEAQAAARAKQLRAKFERWEANEKQREHSEGRVDIYATNVSDDSNIETTKSIRERFENMKSSEIKVPLKPRYQVNRFV